MDNGYTDEEARRILVEKNLDLSEMEYTDSIINTNPDTVYRHEQLQIHSKPGNWNPITGEVTKQPYWLEMKDRYTMNQLLDYYYDKLNIIIEFRDIKRDTGAFNHLITTFKSLKGIEPVDFILFVIDNCSNNKCRITNPLELKNYAQDVYELLEYYVLCNKLDLIRREDVLLNDM